MADAAPARPKNTQMWKKIALRLVFLAFALVSLYFFLPTIVDFLDEAPELASVDWWWYLLMGISMTGAFMAAWELTHIAVPSISRYVAASAQLVSNAMAKVIPGGVVAAGATYFQMLSVSGVSPAKAATALTSVSFISNLVLFSLPGVAVIMAAASAPIPNGLLPVAIAGTVLFIVMFTAVFLLVRYDRPLLIVGTVVEKVVGWLAERLHRNWNPTAEGILRQRNEVRTALGQRWRRALAAAVANWMLDYLVLVLALFAVGSEPRVSLVLLAFAGAAVLGMIPLTPGGLGFVEVGLVAMLTLAGIPGPDATLATLAYRLFQFWLPIPAGAVAYVVFRRRFGAPELPEAVA